MDRLQWKARIGLVVVSSSTVAETRYPRVGSPDIGFFTSRMLLRPGGELEALVEMESSAGRAVEELASAQRRFHRLLLHRQRCPAGTGEGCRVLSGNAAAVGHRHHLHHACLH